MPLSFKPITEQPAEYGSVADIAERYGISKNTVRRRIADGTVKAYRIGPRVLRIRYRDFEKAMRRLPTVKVA